MWCNGSLRKRTTWGFLFCAACLLLLPALSSAQAGVPTLSTPVQIGSDNVVNNAGPSVVYFNNQYELLYTNHSNSYLYVDAGLTGSPTNTGIYVGNGTGQDTLGQVKATVLNNTLYVSYTSYGNSYIASSTNGTTFSSPWVPAYSNTPNYWYVPTIYAFNGALWAAYVTESAYGPEVIIDESSNGGNTFQEEGETSTYTPYSTVSLTSYSGTLYAAYVTYSTSCEFNNTCAVFGAVQGGSYYLLYDDSFGYKNISVGGYTVRAGVLLIGVPGEGIYIYGSSWSSNQDLLNAGTASPPDFPANVVSGSQSLRWDVGGTLGPNNTVFLVYQQSGATNMDETYVTGYGGPY